VQGIKENLDNLCDCESVKEELNEMKARLEECKEAKHNECKEERAKAVATISSLENKLTLFKIIAAVAVTVIGKEMAEKIYDRFIQATNIVEQVQNPIGEKESGSNEVADDAVDILPDGFQGSGKP
jgi:dynactin complex subunit